MNQQDQSFLVQNIRAQYVEKEASDLDALRRLDGKVKRPVQIFSYVCGAISALVMGSGMSLVMTDIAEKIGLSSDMMVPGILIGIVGLALAILNYPLHNLLMKKRKKKYAAEILALSEKILPQ